MHHTGHGPADQQGSEHTGGPSCRSPSRSLVGEPQLWLMSSGSGTHPGDCVTISNCISPNHPGNHKTGTAQESRDPNHPGSWPSRVDSRPRQLCMSTIPLYHLPICSAYLSCDKKDEGQRDPPAQSLVSGRQLPEVRKDLDKHSHAKPHSLPQGLCTARMGVVQGRGWRHGLNDAGLKVKAWRGWRGSHS